jgi:hypothetical protein
VYISGNDGSAAGGGATPVDVDVPTVGVEVGRDDVDDVRATEGTKLDGVGELVRIC